MLPPYVVGLSARTRQSLLAGSPGAVEPMPITLSAYGRTLIVVADAAVPKPMLRASTVPAIANNRSFIQLLLPPKGERARRSSPHRCRAGRDRDGPEKNGRKRRKHHRLRRGSSCALPPALAGTFRRPAHDQSSRLLMKSPDGRAVRRDPCGPPRCVSRVPSGKTRAA